MKAQLDEMQKVISKQANEIQELETRLQGYDDMKNKLTQQEQIIDRCLKTNDLLHKSLSNFEKKLRIFAKITAEVEPIHIIKGTIDIIEGLNKLDKQRSKYIINTDGSAKLGEKEYQNGTQITSLKQKISIKLESYGKFFLHALIVDESGETDEIVSEPFWLW